MPDAGDETRAPEARIHDEFLDLLRVDPAFDEETVARVEALLANGELSNVGSVLQALEPHIEEPE